MFVFALVLSRIQVGLFFSGVIGLYGFPSIIYQVYIYVEVVVGIGPIQCQVAKFVQQGTRCHIGGIPGKRQCRRFIPVPPQLER